MKVTVDTNVLVRVAVGDDPVQSPKAARIMQEASCIAVSNVSLCEFVWVLARGYKRPVTDIAVAIRSLMNSDTVEMDRPAIEAGLRVLESGGDFADGVIAIEGRRLGGDIFVSFDIQAIDILKIQGSQTCLL